MAGRHSELEERDEPPMGARPLLVWMSAESAVSLLAAEERADDRPSEDGLGVGLDVLAEYLSTSQIPDGWFLRSKQPLDRRGRVDLMRNHTHPTRIPPRPAEVNFGGGRDLKADA
jgi:hypothetical protein